MRVISGKAGSIPLISLDMRTRPLSDRAKSALFDIIRDKIPESVVLDLYAGSGALGIEALSRGARNATFVDISKRSCQSVRMNLQKTHFEENADVVQIKADEFIKENIGEEYDIIFVCPPYPEAKYYMAKSAAQLLAPHGILIFEHHKKDHFKPVEDIELIDTRTYGIVQFDIYQKEE